MYKDPCRAWRTSKQLFNQKYGQLEKDIVSWKQGDCSVAAVNLDKMELERAEGINLVCLVAQGHGKWKNEHATYRLSQCLNVSVPLQPATWAGTRCLLV